MSVFHKGMKGVKTSRKVGVLRWEKRHIHGQTVNVAICEPASCAYPMRWRSGVGHWESRSTSVSMDEATPVLMGSRWQR